MRLESVHNNQTNDCLAVVIRGQEIPDGVQFYTTKDQPLQVASIKHQAGKVIQTHIHNEMLREISKTTEVLIIRSGVLRVLFPFGSPASVVLQPNDAVILFQGAHGFEVLEDLEMWEVKQGPYLESFDKVTVVPR